MITNEESKRFCRLRRMPWPTLSLAGSDVHQRGGAVPSPCWRARGLDAKDNTPFSLRKVMQSDPGQPTPKLSWPTFLLRSLLSENALVRHPVAESKYAWIHESLEWNRPKDASRRKSVDEIRVKDAPGRRIELEWSPRVELLEGPGLLPRPLTAGILDAVQLGPVSKPTLEDVYYGFDTAVLARDVLGNGCNGKRDVHIGFGTVCVRVRQRSGTEWHRLFSIELCYGSLLTSNSISPQGEHLQAKERQMSIRILTLRKTKLAPSYSRVNQKVAISHHPQKNTKHWPLGGFEARTSAIAILCGGEATARLVQRAWYEPQNIMAIQSWDDPVGKPSIEEDGRAGQRASRLA
ncbi:hypothetical protein BKA70DRAFT_1229033 [Coprinopsis sp. MPI-PUGE-AT-0042]|nr:hypothetical protein BKA70DRAFT_1229033 [Coprinopsis sp. MPI-PUGE-AT-0042]